jgi:hypothetical protein
LNKKPAEVKKMNGLFAVNGTEKNQESEENTMYDDRQIPINGSVSGNSATTGEWEE